MTNLVYYAPSELYSEDDLESIAFTFNFEGHEVLFCGSNKKYKSFTHEDIIYSRRQSKKIISVDKRRDKLVKAYNMLIYDSRTRDMSGQTLHIEEIPGSKLEKDIKEIVYLSRDIPIILISDPYVPFDRLS